MHSIRETLGIDDLLNSKQLFLSFFEHFRELDTNLDSNMMGNAKRQKTSSAL